MSRQLGPFGRIFISCNRPEDGRYHLLRSMCRAGLRRRSKRFRPDLQCDVPESYRCELFLPVSDALPFHLKRPPLRPLRSSRFLLVVDVFDNSSDAPDERKYVSLCNRCLLPTLAKNPTE